MSTLDDLVPQDHLVRTLVATIDWKFIYPLVKSLYSNFGRRSIDPVVLFKMIFINYTFGISSMKKTCEEIKVNMAYRCPFLSKCTKSKNHEKVITRHVWKADKAETNHKRHTNEWKNIYPKRKETIERVFADAKENQGMRFTRLKGLERNQHESLIIFNCHNLKKLGLNKQRLGLI